MDGAAESTDATRGQAPDQAGHRTRRRAARETIAAYHQARLDELVSHVAAAVDGWREGSLDVYDVDEILHRYQRAARELWKFCWATGGGHVEWVADQLHRLAEDHEAIDWWERGAPHRRSNPTR
jgi:hypothetical protein